MDDTAGCLLLGVAILLIGIVAVVANTHGAEAARSERGVCRTDTAVVSVTDTVTAKAEVTTCRKIRLLGQ